MTKFLSYTRDVKRRSPETLRSYTVPLNLSAFDSLDWATRDEPLDRIGERLDEIRKVRVLTPRMVARLSPMDARTYRAGMLGANRAGLYKPPRKDTQKRQRM